MNYFLVQTVSGREFEAARRLREMFGYESYVPWIERARGKHYRQEAYFRSYIFVRYEIPWHQCDSRHKNCLRGKHGERLLIGPVTAGGICIPIPERELASIALRAAHDRSGDEATAIAPRFRPGDIGIVKSGPFEGQQGEIETIDGDAAQIALRILNAVRPVTVPVENLEAA